MGPSSGKSFVETGGQGLGGHLKSGHLWTGQNRPFRDGRDRCCLPRSLLLTQVDAGLGAPAPWSALEDVSVMEEAVQ